MPLGCFRFEILEFGAVVVSLRGFWEIRSFCTFVRPSSPEAITPASTTANGITREDVRGAPTFREVAHKIYELLDGMGLHTIPFMIPSHSPERLFLHAPSHRVQQGKGLHSTCALQSGGAPPTSTKAARTTPISPGIERPFHELGSWSVRSRPSIPVGTLVMCGLLCTKK